MAPRAGTPGPRSLEAGRQSTAEVLLIEPQGFCANTETAADNRFQQDGDMPGDAVSQRALEEFRRFRRCLEENGVRTAVFENTAGASAPDAVFPNNWFSTHEDGTLVLYPLRFPSRRKERRPDLISRLEERYPRLIDLRSYEHASMYLESTGSLVLDRQSRVAYACISERTHLALVNRWAKLLGYRAFAFHGSDASGAPIYHTNVMMAIGSAFAVICLDAIDDSSERRRMTAMLEASGREIVALSHAQLTSFCGNILELQSRTGERLILMSRRAHDAFTDDQRRTLTRDARLLTPDISTIEQFGGGGVRCMTAELF